MTKEITEEQIEQIKASMETLQKADQALYKTKLGFMSTSSVFLSTVLFNLKFHWVSSIEAIAVQDTDLFINPEWFVNLKPQERVSVLAKEAMHVALQHAARRSDRDINKWCKATTFAVSHLLKEGKMTVGFDHIPECPDEFKGLSANEIYELLPDEDNDDDGDGDGGSATGLGSVASDGTLQDQQKQVGAEQQQEQEDITQKAAVASKMSGKDVANDIPEEVRRMIEERTNPKLPWYVILQNYMSDYDRDDYSYARPNRRYLPDYYLPSMYSEHMGGIGAYIDTSGSISDEDLKVFISEVEGIKEMLNPESVRIVQWGSEIVYDKEFHKEESLDVEYVGGGGTVIGNVIDHIKKHKPEVAIIFTDGYFWDDEYPKVDDTDVIWIVFDNPGFTSPFGKIIHFDLEAAHDKN
jgi:predicted metal-dependent peptidase